MALVCFWNRKSTENGERKNGMKIDYYDASTFPETILPIAQTWQNRLLVVVSAPLHSRVARNDVEVESLRHA